VDVVAACRGQREGSSAEPRTALFERVKVTEHIRSYLREAFKLQRIAQCTAAERDNNADLTETQRKRQDPRLAGNAHKLGHRGHCLTKSRRWSTTFTALRQAREQHVHEQLLVRQGVPESQRALALVDRQQRVSRFKFAGLDHFTAAEAFLAALARGQARKRPLLAA
jgi:hypothetical protein